MSIVNDAFFSDWLLGESWKLDFFYVKKKKTNKSTTDRVCF